MVNNLRTVRRQHYDAVAGTRSTTYAPFFVSGTVGGNKVFALPGPRGDTNEVFRFLPLTPLDPMQIIGRPLFKGRVVLIFNNIVYVV